tara:strand:+ start:320 stop:613 length:294 start_codon:yes stop_codon:yes gene_type:complete
MTKQDIQDYKDKRNLEKGFNAYWNKGFDEAIALLNSDEPAINFIPCCTELVCVDSVNYEYLTLGKKYKLEAETENYYTVDNDLGHAVSMSKVRFDKL